MLEVSLIPSLPARPDRSRTRQLRVTSAVAPASPSRARRLCGNFLVRRPRLEPRDQEDKLVKNSCWVQNNGTLISFGLCVPHNFTICLNLPSYPNRSRETWLIYLESLHSNILSFLKIVINIISKKSEDIRKNQNSPRLLRLFPEFVTSFEKCRENVLS